MVIYCDIAHCIFVPLNAKFRSGSHIKDLNYNLDQLLPEWIHVLQYTLVAALKHFASGPWIILVQISLPLLGLTCGWRVGHNPQSSS